LRQGWADDTQERTLVFDRWRSTTEQAERLLTLSADLRWGRECLWDAVQVVGRRSGEIRDRAINQWLQERTLVLDETLRVLQRLDPPRIQQLVERLQAQAAELLTFLDGLAQALAAGQTRLRQHFPEATWAAFFQASVARLWRLEHALRNGHRQFRAATRAARQRVAEFVAEDPQARPLAEALLTLLERSVRTRSAAETINSVLRPYLNGRRECTDQVSRQLFLNLFALWFNTQKSGVLCLPKFERGPRQGRSPYQLAGIDLGTDDWLTLLGFPPD